MKKEKHGIPNVGGFLHAETWREIRYFLFQPPVVMLKPVKPNQLGIDVIAWWFGHQLQFVWVRSTLFLSWVMTHHPRCVVVFFSICLFFSIFISRNNYRISEFLFFGSYFFCFSTEPIFHWTSPSVHMATDRPDLGTVNGRPGIPRCSCLVEHGPWTLGWLDFLDQLCF